MRANQRVEFGMVSEVRHDERADWHHDELLAPRKLQRRARKLCGDALVTKHGRHLGVIEDEPVRRIVVIPKDGKAFRKSSFEAARGRVVHDLNRTGSSGSSNLFIHVSNLAPAFSASNPPRHGPLSTNGG